MKKICKIFGLVLVLLLTAIIGFGAKNQETDTQDNATNPAGSQLVVEADDIQMIYDEESKSLQITDQSGYVWSSVVDEDLYSSEKLNESWQKNVKSIFHISYADIADANPTIKTGFSYNADIKAKKSDEGIRLDCNFSKEGISLSMIFSVKDGEMVVSVPSADIQEKKKNKLLSVEILPYFGACANTEEGYMVYPDGSGALKYHTSINSDTLTNSSYKWDVYGNELTTLETVKENQIEGLQIAMLPVFGMKKGEHAYIAYSEKGEEEGTINMYPSGAGIDLNRMSFSFRYRTTYSILMSNININGTNTAQNINGLMYNEEIIQEDHDVHYSFLTAEQADYSGMAQRYRETLLAKGMLNASAAKEDIGVSVNILMAASAQGFFNNTVAVTTTAEQAETIMEMVNEIGFKDKSFFNLKGWGVGGIGVYPQTTKPDNAVSKVSEMVALLNSGNKVSLQMDLFYADQDNGGFDKRSDVIKMGNQNVLTDTSGKLFWFNTATAEQRLQSLMKNYKKAEKRNITFEHIGKVLFRDENVDSKMTRQEVRNAMEKMLKQTEEGGYVSVEGANQYALKYADVIYGLPGTSSEYFISDMDIPFTQMVLYGSIPYTGTYGNLSSDYEKQLLQWLEYGYIPAFELTYSTSEVLKETNYNDLYTSQYESNRERLEKAYQLYEDAISKLHGTYMIEHTVLEDGFVKTEYSNGSIVYINYTQEEKSYDGVTVKARGYVVDAMVGD